MTRSAIEKLPISQLRALRARGEGFDAAAWKEMAELGFAGVLIPEEFGGSGFGYVGLGQVLEAQGRTLAASPLLSTAMTGASALMLTGNQKQKETWLPQIASGELLTALAVDEGAQGQGLRIRLFAYALDGTVLLKSARTQEELQAAVSSPGESPR